MSGEELTTFQTCAFDLKNNATNAAVMLECVSDALQQAQNDRVSNLTSWLLVIFGALIFFSK